MTFDQRIRARVHVAPQPGNIFLGGEVYQNVVNNRYDGTWNLAAIQNPQHFQPQNLLVDAQITADSLHQRTWSKRANSKQGYYTGGGFRSIRARCNYDPCGVIRLGVHPTNIYGLGWLCGLKPPSEDVWQMGTDFSVPLSLSSTQFPDMHGWGQKAYNKAKPKIQKWNGFVFFAEAKDIPVMLKTSASVFKDSWELLLKDAYSSPWFRKQQASEAWKMLPREASDHYINHQFGWRPFLNDLTNLDRLMSSARAEIDKLVRHNNEPRRSRVTLLDETTTNVISQHGGYWEPYFALPCYPVQLGSWFFRAPPTWEVRDEVTTHIWGSGRFKFYRPEFDASLAEFNSAWNRVQQYLQVYGVRVNPSNLYKATPWSWAVDWCVDVGSFFEAVNDAWVDSVVCDYFYVMQHQVRRRVVEVYLPFYDGDVSVAWSRDIETKQRDKVESPYGFDLTWDDLSPRQLSIAAALGLSKSRPSAAGG